MNYRRVFIPGAVYFFTINLRNRKSDLLLKEIGKLRNAIKKVKNSYPFTIEGIVILPDHIHMMIKLPIEDANYPLRIRLIKSIFSHQIQYTDYISPARKHKKETGIWQRRYWEHLIRNEKDYNHHLNYILYNPVKHGYVKKPEDWKFSSIHRDIKLGILPEKWSCDDDFINQQFGELFDSGIVGS